MAREMPWFRIAVAAVFAALVLGVILVARSGNAVPDEVQPIVWNRQACAHCQMLIGDPLHAAQLITSDGEVMAFDDPGCALRYVEERRPAVHRLWFHHGSAERWLTAGEVAFTVGGLTPMGSGLIAVERETPGALDVTAATRLARMQSSGKDAGHEEHPR